LDILAEESSKLAEAVATELEDADALSTLDLVATVADTTANTVKDKAVEASENYAKDWAIRRVAERMETSGPRIETKLAQLKAKKTDAARLEAAVDSQMAEDDGARAMAQGEG